MDYAMRRRPSVGRRLALIMLTSPHIKHRAKKVPVPEHKKDAKYHAYRKRNTIKAREYRAKKKKEKAAKAALLAKLVEKNTKLKEAVAALERQLEKLVSYHQNHQVLVPDDDLFADGIPRLADSLDGLYDLGTLS
jgi:uncharacterized surface protein with fasciclin (FAS1) repeats